MGQVGFGKDASIGKGRFEVENIEQVNYYFDHSSNSHMALSPFCPEGLDCEKIFYNPFTRFGKHGGKLANTNAFKKPIVLADTAGVVQFTSDEKRKFIGKGIQGHSLADKENTVHQGLRNCIAD